MQLSAHQLLRLLQWTDSAFPTGAFVHSGGLETYTQAEVVRTADDLAALIAVRLEAASRTDLIIIHAVMRASDEGDWSMIEACDALCSAAKTARESREASEKIGRRMLASVLNSIGADITPTEHGSWLHRYQEAIMAGQCTGHHAVVHGLACAGLGVDARMGMLAFAYALTANQTAASLKLMSIGQSAAQGVLGAANSAMEAAVEAALTRTLDDFGAFTPGLDIRAMHHERLFRRLFIS